MKLINSWCWRNLTSSPRKVVPSGLPSSCSPFWCLAAPWRTRTPVIPWTGRLPPSSCCRSRSGGWTPTSDLFRTRACGRLRIACRGMPPVLLQLNTCGSCWFHIIIIVCCWQIIEYGKCVFIWCSLAWNKFYVEIGPVKFCWCTQKSRNFEVFMIC